MTDFLHPPLPEEDELDELEDWLSAGEETPDNLAGADDDAEPEVKE